MSHRYSAAKPCHLESTTVRKGVGWLQAQIKAGFE